MGSSMMYEYVPVLTILKYEIIKSQYLVRWMLLPWPIYL